MKVNLNSVFIASLLATTLLSTAMADVRLLRQEPGMLRLAYTADRAETSGCDHKVLIGIPLQGDVTLSVVRTTVSPTVTAGPAKAPCQQSSHPSPAYLGAIGFLREQRVVEVWFSRAGHHDQTFEEIVVDLNLPTSTSGTHAPRLESFAEELYSGAMVNYEQARRWRRSQYHGRLKPVTQTHGRRLKLSLSRTGIYRITGEDLQRVGVDLSLISPPEIALHYGGGRALAAAVGASSDHQLQEIEILVTDGGDGRFDPHDSILFYGESLARWIGDPSTGFQHIRHPYSDTNVYWLSLGAGQGAARGHVQPPVSGTPSTTRETHRVRLHQEVETSTTYFAQGNIQSGLEWYWKDLRAGDSESFALWISRPVSGPTTIRLRFVARTESSRLFSVNWNGRRVGTATFEAEGPHLFEFATDRAPLDGSNELTLTNNSGSLSLFDWYELEFDRQLEAEDDALFFHATDTSGIVEYRLSGFSEQPRLFEVSDGLKEIVAITHDSTSGAVVFQDSAGPARSYVALTPERMRNLSRIETVDWHDLKQGEVSGADYLIISHADFLDQAERLAAWRKSDDRFGPPVSAAVVDVQDIYNSFSGGLLDPTAIRDFVSHTTSNWDPVPFFVLLFGDGSYDYKNNSGTSTGNWIPPYEDRDLTYDDWYVCVVGEDALPDMAIGRLPVQTAIDARTIVDKLIDYDSNLEFGDWHARALIVADDTYNADDLTVVEAMFVRDAEDLASHFLPADVDVEKLYLLEFPLEGRFKPSARDAFIDRFNAGSLLLVYIGHGNAQVFAHEHIFVVSTDLEQIDNGRRLPFLYTAASQMAVFDDPVRDSIPEALLKRTGGGIIGMIGATRVGFHQSNMALARSFHRLMFGTGRQHVPVGLGLMEAKAVSDASLSRILRYNLFGDPLTRLARPAFAVHMEATQDTLRALGEAHVAGRLVDEEGKLLDDFSGQVRVQVFDSTIQRVATDRNETMEYEKHGAPIYRGLVPVVDGRFETVFRTPKDIAYGTGGGRMTAYAWDGRVSAYGAAGPIAFSGTDELAPPDDDGPEIELTLDGRGSGDEQQVLQVGPTTLLHARLRDPSGINITGEIGHRIELRIDGEVTDVTGRYETMSDYREGDLQIRLSGLEPGKHRLQLEAWDTYNNWAVESIAFRVGDAVDALSNVLFHPNPTRDGGHFTFSLSQASPAVHIQVFSVAGTPVAELKGTGTEGYNQIVWHPEQELASGTYLFKISADGLDGDSSHENGVIQVMR